LKQIIQTTSAGKEGELRTTMPFAKHWSHEKIVHSVQASQPARAQGSKRFGHKLVSELAFLAGNKERKAQMERRGDVDV
jgi:hypothetical protein